MELLEGFRSVHPPLFAGGRFTGCGHLTARGTLQELHKRDEEEWRRLQEEENRREERREIDRAREAADREERDERRYREMRERQEGYHREVVAREERWREEMRARDERRDQEAAARDERFLAILEMLAKKLFFMLCRNVCSLIYLFKCNFIYFRSIVQYCSCIMLTK